MAISPSDRFGVGLPDKVIGAGFLPSDEPIDNELRCEVCYEPDIGRCRNIGWVAAANRGRKIRDIGYAEFMIFVLMK